MAMMNAIGNLRKMMLKGPQLPEGDRNARVIAVAAQKGGVGKTTTTVHLAAGLALYHKRKVLLIDMDAQGHVSMSLSKVLGEQAQDKESFGGLLLEKGRDLYEIAQETEIEGLSIIPSDRALNETESMMSARIGKELLLRQSLKVARTHYDVILIDCPPNLGNLTVNALTAADEVLIPCDMSVLSLDGVAAILDTLETLRETLNPNIRPLGLLRTRVDRRNITMNRTIEETLEKWYSSWVLNTVIGVSTAVNKAQLDGQTVFSYNKRDRAATFYKELSDEIDSIIFNDV